VDDSSRLQPLPETVRETINLIVDTICSVYNTNLRQLLCLVVTNTGVEFGWMGGGGRPELTTMAEFLEMFTFYSAEHPLPPDWHPLQEEPLRSRLLQVKEQLVLAHANNSRLHSCFIVRAALGTGHRSCFLLLDGQHVQLGVSDTEMLRTVDLFSTLHDDP